jgi:hypothetical protein
MHREEVHIRCRRYQVLEMLGDYGAVSSMRRTITPIRGVVLPILENGNHLAKVAQHHWSPGEEFD